MSTGNYPKSIANPAYVDKCPPYAAIIPASLSLPLQLSRSIGPWQQAMDPYFWYPKRG